MSHSIHESILSYPPEIIHTSRNSYKRFSKSLIITQGFFDLASLNWSNVIMLGRVRRITRVDVGLAISFVGIAYLAWMMVMAGVRHLINNLIEAESQFAIGGFLGAFATSTWLFDLVGLLWLIVGLILIIGASRQRWSISAPLVCAICQVILATILSVWAGNCAEAYAIALAKGTAELTADVQERLTWVGLYIFFGIALVLWGAVLLWLLGERARLRHGPKPRDGLRTNIPA